MLESTKNSNPAAIESSDTEVNGALQFCNDCRLRRVDDKNSRASVQRLMPEIKAHRRVDHFIAKT